MTKQQQQQQYEQRRLAYLFLLEGNGGISTDEEEAVSLSWISVICWFVISSSLVRVWVTPSPIRDLLLFDNQSYYNQEWKLITADTFR